MLSTAGALARCAPVLIAVACLTACVDSTSPNRAPAASRPSADVIGGIVITWEYTALGSLGGQNGIATGINDSGVVVGWSETSFGKRVPFLWKNGVMTKIVMPLLFSAAYPTAINLSGQFVGHLQLLGGERRAFFRDTDGSAVILPRYSNTDTVSVAHDINASGVIVGSSGTRAVRWQFLRGLWSVTDLGNLGGSFSGAMGVNGSGWMTGYAATGAGWLLAWRRSGVTAMDSIGSIGGPESYGKDINTAGDIAGTALLPNPPDGFYCSYFLWRSTTGIMTDLGVRTTCDPDGEDVAINDQRRIVGTHGPEEKAFTIKGASMTILPGVLNWASFAVDVNSCGLIVGALRTVPSGILIPVRWRRLANGVPTCD